MIALTPQAAQVALNAAVIGAGLACGVLSVLYLKVAVETFILIALAAVIWINVRPVPVLPMFAALAALAGAMFGDSLRELPLPLHFVAG